MLALALALTLNPLQTLTVPLTLVVRVPETDAPNDKEAVPVFVLVTVGLAVMEEEGVTNPVLVVVIVALIDPEGVLEAV